MGPMPFNIPGSGKKDRNNHGGDEQGETKTEPSDDSQEVEGKPEDNN